jgi:hypothetical protein
MFYLVEVFRIGRNLAEPMAEMRAWFDRTGIEPALFDHCTGGAGIAFRLAFRSEGSAAAFAGAFDGRMLSGEPCEAALWQINRTPIPDQPGTTRPAPPSAAP